MSLLTSINEKVPGDFFFTTPSPVGQITGPGIIGTITRANPTVSTIIPYTFKAGVYFVSLQVELDVNTSTVGDVLICSTAQDGVLNPDQIIQTTNTSNIASGEAVRLMLTGYINAQPGPTGLNIVVSTYTAIGVSSSYQIQIPTDSKIFIQQVA